MTSRPPILFTAFEPSGDALAAPVIAELRHRRPEQPIVAMGGPKMQAAGAELLETTTGDAVMLADSFGKVREHAARIKRLRAWLGHNPITALVPVDSPAANWHACKAVRQLAPQTRIIHLAAPQLWAWAPWRIRKLRRLTDKVLCILPFEPKWFGARGVDAVFVGHPILDPPPACDPDPQSIADLPAGGSPKLALLPGSRPKEISRNWPTMHHAVQRLKTKHPQLTPVIAATNEDTAAQLRATAPDIDWPIKIDRVHDILDWADIALVVSGTATLHTLSHRVPLVTLYNVNRWGWYLARMLIQTRTFTLPNLIGEAMDLGRIVPELAPHFGEVEPVEQALGELISNDEAREKQRAAFDQIRAVYEQTPFVETAATGLESATDEGKA